MPPKVGRTVTAPRRTPPSSAGSEGSTRRRSARHTQGDASWSLPALPDSILMRPPERWVCVHFKLLHVSLLDDVVRLPPNATLHTLEAKLMAHHGGAVKGIEMYKDDTQPKNKLRDFSLTLKEAFGLEDAMPSTVPFPNIPSSSGVGPALVLSPEDHHVTVCYDFKSHDSDCPLLNRSPRYRSGQPSYGDANNNNNTGGAQHSSTSRFLNQTTTSTTGGGASPSAASNANNNNSSTTTTSAVANNNIKGGKDQDNNNSTLHQIGLTAPLTISTSSGENLGVGVGSARGGK